MTGLIGFRELVEAMAGHSSVMLADVQAFGSFAEGAEQATRGAALEAGVDPDALLNVARSFGEICVEELSPGEQSATGFAAGFICACLALGRAGRLKP